MRALTVVAAGMLAVGFGWVSYVLLFVEPGMGFTEPADFFDAEKAAAGYTSLVWSVGSVVYMLFLPAAWVISRSSDNLYVRWSGIAAGLLFLVVGTIDRVGGQLSAMLSTDEAVIAAVAAMLPVRFALLKSGVVTLGVLAWGTTRVSFAGGVGNRIWRGFGWLTLLASMGFLFLFIPVPLVFFVWGVTLTFLLLRNSRTSVSAHTATE
jgi:hypothetical protein